MRARRLATAVLLAAGLCAATPGAASAAEVWMSGTTLAFLDDTNVSNDVTIVREPALYRITDTKATIVPRSDSPCTSVNTHEVTCPASDVDDVFAFLEAGADDLALTTSVPSTVCGGAGADELTGGAGDDGFIGGDGTDTLRGGGGADLLWAGRLGDLDCDAGTEPPPPDDTLDGGAGDDALFGDAGPDRLLGGDGRDRLLAMPGDDHLDGGADGDVMLGLEGRDELLGQGGPDILNGGDDADTLFAGADADELGTTVRWDPDGSAGSAPFRVIRDEGDDAMYGDGGDDLLVGGVAGPSKPLNIGVPPAQYAGLPPLDTAAFNGADTLQGGDGADTLTYLGRTSPVGVSLDNVRNDGGAGEGDQAAADVETVVGTPAADTLTAGPGPQTLDGADGPDVLDGGDGPDRLLGGGDEATDRLTGGPGDDELGGGSGNDALAGDAGVDRLNGGGGDDGLDGGPDGDDLRGGTGRDTLRGGTGGDRLDGEADADTADYADTTQPVRVDLADPRGDGVAGEDALAGVENVTGGAGPDTLRGDAAVNALTGGGGDDLLDGRGGADALSAGAGADALFARDGATDALACGAGSDFAVVDAADARSPVRGERCEHASTPRTGPALGRRVVLEPACAVPVRLAGARRAVPLAQRAAVPVGTRADTRRCRVRVVADAGRRRRQRVTVSRGVAAIGQPRARRPALELRLAASAPRCPRRSARVLRRLAVDGRGAFRVRGRRTWTAAGSAARRTAWVTEDRCDGTLTRVRRGRVTVQVRGSNRLRAVRGGGRLLVR